MNIPQVNADVTDRNHEQTMRICELLGYFYSVRCLYWVTKNGRLIMQLPNGSFTLCQIVGMLEAEGVCWVRSEVEHPGWYVSEGGEFILGAYNPHDLTAAMDALIKVLEAKQ